MTPWKRGLCWEHKEVEDKEDHTHDLGHMTLEELNEMEKSREEWRLLIHDNHQELKLTWWDMMTMLEKSMFTSVIQLKH